MNNTRWNVKQHNITIHDNTLQIQSTLIIFPTGTPVCLKAFFLKWERWLYKDDPVFIVSILARIAIHVHVFNLTKSSPDLESIKWFVLIFDLNPTLTKRNTLDYKNPRWLFSWFFGVSQTKSIHILNGLCYTVLFLSSYRWINKMTPDCFIH